MAGTSVAMPTMTTGAGIPSPQNQITSLPYMIPSGGATRAPIVNLPYTVSDGLGQPKTITPLSATAGNPNTPVPGMNSANNPNSTQNIPMPNMADVQKQMAANSAAYNATTDKTTQNNLHAQNMNLGASVGGSYDANTGKWSFPNTPTPPINSSGTPPASTTNTLVPGMTSGTAPLPPTTQPTSQSGSPQSTNQYTQLTPAQLQQEVQSRIDQLRQGVQQGVSAYDTARKNAYDYANQMTNDNRVLAAGMFHEQNDPFAGSTNYKEAETLRSNNMQDAAAAATYQADVAANDQKLADFNASAPGQEQTMYDQLANTERTFGQQQDQQNFNQGIAQAGLTGQYQGAPTLQAQGQKFQEGVTTAGLTGKNPDGTPTLQAQGQTFNQNMATKQFDNTVTQQQIQNGQWSKTFDNQMKQWAAQNKLDWANLNKSQQISLAQLAISQQNADTSRQNANTTAANDTARVGIEQQSANNSVADTKQTQLMNDWKASGVAPEGIPGVTAGTPYAGSSVQQTHANESKWSTQFDALPAGQQVSAVESNKAAIIKELGSPAYNSMHAQYVAQSAKDSTNNLSSAISQLQSPGITRAQALQYAQKIQSHMSSADYKRLNSWIGTNLH